MSNSRFRLVLGVLPLLLLAWTEPTLAEEPKPFWTQEVGEGWHQITSLARRGGQLVVAGKTEHTTAPYSHVSFVSARDTSSGEQGWSQPIEGGFRYMRVETHGSRVYLITTGDQDTADQEGRVVAFRASDGEILWEDHIPHVARQGNRVFVLPGARRTVAISSLDLDPPDGSFRGGVGAQIRAYDARGQREWDLTLGGAHPEWDFSVRAAAMRGRFLWIAGSVDYDWVVRCYDARDGTLVWEDRLTVPDMAGALDSESDYEGADLMVLRGRTLVVAGSKNPQANPSSEDPLVRAYDARDGRVLWTYASSEDEKDEFPRHIALSGSKVVVEWLRSGNDWSTRLDAFDLRTGAVVSQLPLDAVVNDMKAAGRALVLVGSFNGTANPPERDEPEGFVMGIDTRGSLLTTWEARPLYSVQTVEVAGPHVYAAMAYFLLAYDPTPANGRVVP